MKGAFEHRPPDSPSTTPTDAMSNPLSGPCQHLYHLSNIRLCLNNKLYFGLTAIEIAQKSSARKNHEHPDSAPDSSSTTPTDALSNPLSRPYHHLYHLSNNRLCLHNKLYFGLTAIEIAQKSRSAWKNHKKSKIIVQKKRKNGQLINLHKRQTHVYNNCFSFESN